MCHQIGDDGADDGTGDHAGDPGDNKEGQWSPEL